MQLLIKNTISLLALSLAINANAQELTSGEVIGRHIYGLANDYQGDPLMIDEKPVIHSSALFEDTIKFKTVNYVVSGFSSNISSVFITRLEPKKNTPIDTDALDLASIEGLNSISSSTTTAWGSVLFSENQNVNAADPGAFIESFSPYFKHKSDLVNPYNYGWVTEVIVFNEKGEAKAIKNYSLGRVFADQILLMPDAKTVYMLDKAGYLFAFVSEQANSLAKGKLYGVTNENNQIHYTLLGDQSALKVKFKIKKADFKSIFLSTTPKNGQCKKTFKLIKTQFGDECLKLNNKNKKYAAYLEPQRYMVLNELPAFTSENIHMQFDKNINQIQLIRNQSLDTSLSLGNDEKLASQFIIKERI